MAPTTQVLTLDVQPLFHYGVAGMLSPFVDLAIQGAAYSTDEAIGMCRRRMPEVILLEIQAFGPAWAAALRELQAACPGPRLLVLTRGFDAQAVLAALQLGVAGYLLTTVEPAALAHGIRTVAAGHMAFGAEAMRVILSHERERTSSLERLTQREREILTYLVRGLSNSEIGERLCISTATVKFHSRNLFGKLNVASRARAIALAYQHQLVPTVVVGEGGDGPGRYSERAAGAPRDLVR